MTRGDLDPKELTNKYVVDNEGSPLGTVRRVRYDPSRGVEGVDVEVDQDTRTRFAEVDPYVELVPDEVEHVGTGEIVLSSTLQEIVDRGTSPGFCYTLDLEGEGGIDVELIGEPAEDPEWGDDDWTPAWADTDT